MDTRIAHLEKSFHENLCEESTGAENANSNVAHNNSAVVNTLGISRSARVDADNVWRPAIRIVPTEEVAQIESTRTSPAVMVKTRHMPGDTIRMHVCRGRESKTRMTCVSVATTLTFGRIRGGLPGGAAGGAGGAAGGPAAVGLGDSWKRGPDNPHDLMFWRIRLCMTTLYSQCPHL